MAFLRANFYKYTFGLLYTNNSLSVVKNPKEQNCLQLTANEKIIKKCFKQLKTGCHVEIRNEDILHSDNPNDKTWKQDLNLPSTSISTHCRYAISDESDDESSVAEMSSNVKRVLFPTKKTNKNHYPPSTSNSTYSRYVISDKCCYLNKMANVSSNVRRVLFSTKTTNKKHYSTKNNMCVYCQKSNAKLSRHLVTVHKNEKEVKELLKFPKGSHEKNKIYDTLRKNGNYKYNVENENEIFLVRRPHNKEVNSDNYKPCANCKGYYSFKSLRQHYARCASGTVETGRRNILIKSRAIERKAHCRANTVLRDIVLPVMREDEDALRPQRFDDAIKGINAVAGLRNGKYSSPATAFSLGLLLKDATKLLITECIKKEDNQRKKNAQDFLKLLESELNASINKTVTENWSERQRQKKVILPSREDIKILITFLHKKRKRLVENLKETFSYHE
ncbi:hypothetical protein Zmor_006783 [Zophobas morio]|uniref:Uncharacterized protein n=1 Tax=Zophobas morio TaxID=2755281 RepID=A0AA38IVI9_9CUCU|nr:hypothetical protein Zmor_006783 [Zophobas morio]